MLATAAGQFILETVGDFFSNDTAYFLGHAVLFLLIIVWVLMQVRGFQKALRMKREGDISIQAAQLEVQQQILQRLNDQTISQEERAVLLDQLSRPGRN
jgi:hypothetical protein